MCFLSLADLYLEMIPLPVDGQDVQVDGHAVLECQHVQEHQQACLAARLGLLLNNQHHKSK